jgi:hypothetical protein
MINLEEPITTCEPNSTSFTVSESLTLVESPTLAASQEPVRLIQELCECNQSLLTRTANLESDLESSQERIAQLERECAMHQQRYDEQAHQLMQSEDRCRDLKIRLHRHQEHALQLKAALEKSLQGSGLGSDYLELSGEGYQSPFLTPQAPPIQSWSAPIDALFANNVEIIDASYEAFHFTPEPVTTIDSFPSDYSFLTDWNQSSIDEFGPSPDSLFSSTAAGIDAPHPSQSSSPVAPPANSKPQISPSLPPFFQKEKAKKDANSSSPSAQTSAVRWTSFVINPQRFAQTRPSATIDLPAFLQTRFSSSPLQA